MQTTALGYLRVPTSTSDERVSQLERDIYAYAERQGMKLSTLFADRSDEQTSGFSLLVDALERKESQHVIVPALHHFAHSPGMRLAIKELLEDRTGAEVIVMHPSPEEPS
ncbi:recombinase family protein [Glycomyces xiaoerkulensis]|uniref:recombinase family protein n=1 Tax=Glycomyces xiaoerkulensis TaxID=2038139 RepID=UPI0018E496F5|nr:recombinase family protein [Glycomyces xiaoerkulensis]